MKVQILQIYLDLEEATRNIAGIAAKNKQIRPLATKLKTVTRSFAEIVSLQWDQGRDRLNS